MFFVGTRKRITSNTFLLHVLPAALVLLTVMGLTLLSWNNAKNSFESERQAETTRLAVETEGRILDRMNAYEVMLKGASGLFLASNNVTREEWKTFVGEFDLQQKYPGILGVGYGPYAARDDIPSLLNQLRDEGFSNVSVSPPGVRERYVLNILFEPLVPNRLGYDMLTEPARREAILHAKNTGESSLSGKVQFSPDNVTGIAMYMPVYMDRTQQEYSPADRTTAGFVYVSLSASELFDGILEGKLADRYTLQIYDSSTQSANLLYESRDYTDLTPRNSLTYEVPLDVYGRKWIMRYRFPPEVVAKTSRERPVNTLAVGTLLSVILAGFVLTLLITRSNALSNAKSREVQDAKDELLSLASHQLRTPATSVKQYLGMLREGFAGKLSKQQHPLVEKAYESNERQLHIINELLYVAKLDAKGIVLTPRRLDLHKLLRSVIQDLDEETKQHGQTIKLKVPPKRTFLVADEHCLRMSVENLINNALKYSYDDSAVVVRVTAGRQMVSISVKDTGVGIDESEIPLLFQRFSRIPNELSRHISGSGIGLYLSRRLIELHDGTVSVESTKGKGSTFTIRLPRNTKDA